MHGVPLYDCPFRVLSPRIRALSGWLGDWRGGRLPVGKGLLHESAWFVSAMRFLNAEVEELMKGLSKDGD